jgi:radical SAM superfamily enzyme YgiQ (UPF0313 family)
MKKLLLLNPPFLPNYSRDSRSPAVTRSGTIYYPIWLSYAAGYLIRKKVNVKLIDAIADPVPWKQFSKYLSDENYDIIAIHTSTPSIESDGKIAQDIKKILPTARIYLTGTHVSALPEETLKLFPDVDGVVVGELEYPLLDLAKGLPLNEVRGIVYRDGNRIFHSKPNEVFKELFQLEWVSKIYRKFLNIDNYFYSALRYPVITINAGRGCHYNCSFCVLPQVFTGHNVRLREVDDIIAELEYIKSEMPWVKEIMFEDDTFTIDQLWLKRFCLELIVRKIKIRWSANARAELSLNTLKLMKLAGLRLLFVGFESPNKKTLHSIHKEITPEQQQVFMANTRLAKVKVHGSFIFGLPGETMGDLGDTISYAIKLQPDTCQFFPLIPYPGTEMFHQLNKKGHIKFEKYRDYLTPEGYHSTVLAYPDISTYEILAMCRIARRIFYKRPGYILKKISQVLFNPGEAKRIIRAYWNFRKHMK